MENTLTLRKQKHYQYMTPHSMNFGNIKFPDFSKYKNKTFIQVTQGRLWFKTKLRTL